MAAEECENKAPKVSKSDIPLEEQCQRAMDSIVNMRIRYTEHLQSQDIKIAKYEAALLHREMRRKIQPLQDIKLNPSAYKFLDKKYDTSVIDQSEQRELMSKIETMSKIFAQIRNDKRRALLNEPIDSESILNKVKSKHNID